MKRDVRQTSVWRWVLIWMATLAILLGGCSQSPNVVTWETASEVNTAGFNLYRGSSPDGPWTKVNDALIPAAEDPMRGGSYRYVDEKATPGQIYYYQLEEVELGGAANRYPPTQLESRDEWIGWLWWLAAGGAVVLAGWWAQRRIRARRG